MNRLSTKQLKILLFTVLLLLFALVAYLLIGQGSLTAGIQALVAQPTFTPAPTPETTQEQNVFAATPEAVFVSLMTHDPGFLAKADPEEPCLIHMQCGPAATGRATLLYTLDDEGCISSITITFPLQELPVNKPKTETEIAYAAEYAAFAADQDSAISAILTAAVRGCDLDDVILAPVILKWYTGAVNARDSEKSYADIYRDCVFEAYVMPAGGTRTLVCSLLLP